MLLSVGLALWWLAIHGSGPGNVAILVVAVSSFLTAPLMGARLSVRRINPITGWFWTLGLSGGLPAAFGMGMAFLAEPAGYYGLDRFYSPFVLTFVVVQFLQASLCAWATASDLGSRKFQLKPLQRVPG
jgi:hypothetical protein